jgi:hypothetical protein
VTHENGTRSERSALIDRRLRLQMRIFLVIYLVVTVLVIERLIRGDVNPLWAPAGFALGLVLGLALSRTKVLGWDDSAHAVAGTSDALGIAILVAYVILMVFRSRIISAGIDDADTVGVIGLAMTAGAMLGRVYFTRRGILRILADAGIIQTNAGDA